MLAENHKYKHDRSNRIADSENERIINFVQTENGIVNCFKKDLDFHNV